MRLTETDPKIPGTVVAWLNTSTALIRSISGKEYQLHISQTRTRKLPKPGTLVRFRIPKRFFIVDIETVGQ